MCIRDRDNVESNYAYFPVVFDGYKYTRNEVFEKLAEVGIGAVSYTHLDVYKRQEYENKK